MTIPMEGSADAEIRNINQVHHHLRCIAAAANDGSALPALDALLAPDFRWIAPSHDRRRGGARCRNDYLALFDPAVNHPAKLVSLQLHLDRVMAAGDWVAAETHSNGVRADGLPYNNFYHQAWRFDHDGRIAEYRIYSDTASLDELERASKRQSAEDLASFLLSDDKPAISTTLIAESAKWIRVSPCGDIEENSLRAIVSQKGRGATLASGRSFRINYKNTFSSRETICIECASSHPDLSGSPDSIHLLVFQFADYLITAVREYTIGQPLFQKNNE